MDALRHRPIAENGRQVTRTAEPELARRLLILIDNGRRLRQLVGQLEQGHMSSIATERSTPSPPPPKRSKKT